MSIFNLITPNKAVLVVLVILLSSTAMAAFEIRKYTINNGGTTLSSQSLILNASIGQTAAQSQISSNRFHLTSGFWQENKDLIFVNQF